MCLVTRQQYGISAQAHRSAIVGKPVVAKPWFSNYILIYLSGLSPSDSFDEAQADMILGGVDDLRVAMIKAHFQKDEEEKVRFHS